jgi:hypothetical protein
MAWKKVFRGGLKMRRQAEMNTSQSVRHGANAKTVRTEVDGVFPLMPQQYYDLISRRRVIDGERRLMFAVFEDAIRSFVMCVSSKSAARRKEFEEVKSWMAIRGHHTLFSFDTLCDLFEIEPDLLRHQLTTLHSSDLPRRRIGSIGRRVPMSASM